MKVALFSILTTLVMGVSSAEAHHAHPSCEVNNNPSSPGYGKLFYSVFPNGGAARNLHTQKVSCGRGACAVNVAPTSPGYGRVHCSAFAGGGAAVNERTGKVSCGQGECYYAQNGFVYCYSPSTGRYETGSIDQCEEASIDNCYEARQ